MKMFSHNNLPNAVIFAPESLTLSNEEVEFFKRTNPVGFILFKRNLVNRDQIIELVTQLRAIVDWDCPILIDQEGGRVARLGPPHFRKSPPMQYFAEISKYDFLTAKQAVYLNSLVLGNELIELGINVDCAPVADLRIDGAHDIIGDRSFGSDPDEVALMAREMASGLIASGVLPIIKHIPGHGRALADSHEQLPVVTTDITELEKTDFKVFKLLSDFPMAMTAHIIFKALDENLPVTISNKAINYIRDKIGYNGLLLSDDISMKALKGDLEDLTNAILNAGCDIVLHCNGKMEEMTKIAKAIKPLSNNAADKLKAAIALIKKPLVVDRQDLDSQITQLASIIP